MKNYGPPEKVYVENERYDGPRAGVADINGLPHRFTSEYDDSADNNYLGTFVVFQVDEETLSLEIEQWCIFVEWNNRYEAGTATVETHPGQGGISARWDEIELLLAKKRTEVPANAQKALAKFVRLKREKLFEESGPDYMMCWSILQ